MRVVIPEAPQHLLDWRARTGADRWDEMWGGVLHMPPMPNRAHQDLELAIATWLRVFWGPRGNKVYHQINLAPPGGWPDDYRIPDLLLLTPDRFDIDQNEYFEGAPTVVVEIRSPGDETDQKMPFYAQLGVPEVWVVDGDSKDVQLHVLKRGDYEVQPPGPEGCLHSVGTGVQLRVGPGNKLTLQIEVPLSALAWIVAVTMGAGAYYNWTIRQESPSPVGTRNRLTLASITIIAALQWLELSPLWTPQ